MENTINTMTITLDEYNKLQKIASDLKDVVANKNEVISSQETQVALLYERLEQSRQEVLEVSNTIFVKPNLDLHWTNAYGVKLQKTSPELEKIINDSIDQNTKEHIKNLSRTIDSLREDIYIKDKDIAHERREIIEKHESAIDKLKKQIVTLTEDYENLKLDKAANIIESERLKEINNLNERILELEVAKESKDYILPRGLFTWLFKNKIIKHAETLYETLKDRKDWQRIDAKSALGKGVDYLKTINNKPYSF